MKRKLPVDHPAAEEKPFQITRAQLISKFSSPRLVARLIRANWIRTVRKGGPGLEALFDYQSAETAYDRLKQGEQPPRLPSEEPLKRETTTEAHNPMHV
jgi:hypothetical protein